jgi:hypothetical protein
MDSIVPVVSLVTSIEPRYIQQIKYTILPLLGDPNISLYHCYMCKQPIDHNDRNVISVVVEDPTLPTDTEVLENILVDTCNYVHITQTESKITRNRSLRFYHATLGCYMQIPNILQLCVYQRTQLPLFIQQREECDGRSTIQSYKEQHHLSKLLIASSYSDVNSLVIMCLSVDTNEKDNNELLTKLNKLSLNPPQGPLGSLGLPSSPYTSMIISMPLEVSKCIDLRLEVCTEPIMYSYFQKVIIVDLAMNNDLKTIPAQLHQLKKSLVNPMYTKYIHSVYTIRMINGSTTTHTTWRLIIRFEVNIEEFRRRIYDFFVRQYVNVGSSSKMTWEQFFHQDVIGNTGDRRVLEWIQRRDQLRKDIYGCQTDLTKAFSSIGDLLIQPNAQVFISQPIIQQNNTICEYHINTQTIDTYNTTIVYTQPLHTPLASKLLTWTLKSQSPPSTTPYMYCPYLYNDLDYETHQKDMDTLGFQLLSHPTLPTLIFSQKLTQDISLP